MDIHVVQPGDTMYQIALDYGIPMSRLLQDNPLPDPSRLVVGQALVIQYPRSVYTVQEGDTLSSIAQAHQLSVSQLLRNNPILQGEDLIFPGQVLALSFQQEPSYSCAVTSYAYPTISPKLLHQTLPYLSTLAPFTYRINTEGHLIPIADSALIAAAQEQSVRPVLHLSNTGAYGEFSGDLAHSILNSPALQEVLIQEIVDQCCQKSYGGVDIDFEQVYGSDAPLLAQWIDRLAQVLHPHGAFVTVALAPKTSPHQMGASYQGHDYALLGQAADFVLLMTYEWGYSAGPPMAIAPLPGVQSVVEYALEEIPAEKIWLGIPNYGYDWPLPYQSGHKAVSISNQKAVELAAQHHQAIQYHQADQSPWFRYVDSFGKEHEVWFEDARSIQAKLKLAQHYGLFGVGYWNLMRPFPENWVVLNGLCRILDGNAVFPPVK